MGPGTKVENHWCNWTGRIPKKTRCEKRGDWLFAVCRSLEQRLINKYGVGPTRIAPFWTIQEGIAQFRRTFLSRTGVYWPN